MLLLLLWYVVTGGILHFIHLICIRSLLRLLTTYLSLEVVNDRWSIASFKITQLCYTWKFMDLYSLPWPHGTLYKIHNITSKQKNRRLCFGLKHYLDQRRRTKRAALRCKRPWTWRNASAVPEDLCPPPRLWSPAPDPPVCSMIHRHNKVTLSLSRIVSHNNGDMT